MSVCRGGGSVESARETRYVAIASYPQKNTQEESFANWTLHLNSKTQIKQINWTRNDEVSFFEFSWGKQTHVTTSFMSCSPVYSLSVALFMLWSRKTMLSSRKHWIGREMVWGGRPRSRRRLFVIARRARQLRNEEEEISSGNLEWARMSTGKWERCSRSRGKTHKSVNLDLVYSLIQSSILQLVFLSTQVTLIFERFN